MTAELPPFEPIAGRFIRLEPLTRAHLPELYEALAHPEVFAGGFGGGPAGFRADRDGFLAWAEHGYRFDTELAQPYGIRLVGGAHDGLLVGSSTLADFDLPLESTHIGWTAYDPRVWGTAVNPEAKLLLLGRAFDSGFGRVKIQADALNDRSRAAILKLGAQFEGIMRRERPRADGSWRDTAVYSVIIDEWPAVRAGLLARLGALSDHPVTLAAR
ncbi:GNAT family protein [Leifsonia sp. YIM 134122]|uniref:GNAT family protein n=1 Tax=Leifsonia stereocauli TaxID=3134136 RepID=A0ABU9W3U3_9MICO